MKILIIEDENRAANRVERLLLEIDPGFEIVGKLESIAESISWLTNQTPDLIISDIQLADGLSFEIYSQIDCKCPIIFTTAYDRYAIDAFETNGIDYLLKPIEKERLGQALNKLEKLKPSISLDQLLKLTTANAGKAFKERFMIKVGDKIRTIPVTDISAFYSLDKGTYLHTVSNRNYVLEFSLEQVMEMLDPKKYFRINRKHIVSINCIDEIIAHTNSRLKLKIKDFENEDIIVAREKVKDFKLWLDQ